MMSLKQFVKQHSLVSCEKNTGLQDLARQMKERDVGSILVLDQKKPVGIVTDRDLVLRGIAEKGTNAQVTAGDLMSSPVHTAPIDAGIHDVISLMRDQSVRRIVVVDNNSEPVSLISHGDVLELIATELGELVSGTAPSKQKLVGEQKQRQAS